ncbi:MAG TPA: signal peptidase I [Acholeplasmataceae bacterium]|jgi:signal peptidase|nr:signal peptidase I [Acholeplasmataceae bacterium]
MDNVKKQMKKTLAAAAVILSYIALFFLGLYVIMYLAFPRYLIKVFQYQHITVVSDSMEPVINVDDMIIIKNYDPERLQPGDIITFYVDINGDGKKEMVTHFFHERTTAAGEIVYRTRSNISNTPDEWEIGVSDIVGKYVGRVPRIGKLIRFLRHPIGIMALLANILVIMLIVKLLKGKEKKI